MPRNGMPFSRAYRIAVDLALDAAVAEAAGNEDAVNPGEMRLGAVLLDLLRVDPPDVHVNVVRHARRA